MDLFGGIASTFAFPIIGGLYFLVVLLALILGVGIRLIDITSDIKRNQQK